MDRWLAPTSESGCAAVLIWGDNDRAVLRSGCATSMAWACRWSGESRLSGQDGDEEKMSTPDRIR
jgi:hypothetical protein